MINFGKSGGSGSSGSGSDGGGSGSGWKIGASTSLVGSTAYNLRSYIDATRIVNEWGHFQAFNHDYPKRRYQTIKIFARKISCCRAEQIGATQSYHSRKFALSRYASFCNFS